MHKNYSTNLFQSFLQLSIFYAEPGHKQAINSTPKVAHDLTCLRKNVVNQQDQLASQKAQLAGSVLC